MVTRPGSRPRGQPNNIDLLSSPISDLTRRLQRPIIITWVRGHQDSTTTAGTTLSRDALNNIAVDALVTLHRTERRLLPRQQIHHLA